jgi:glycosyltransferase involved in cell wall biosynthesis
MSAFRRLGAGEGWFVEALAKSGFPEFAAAGGSYGNNGHTVEVHPGNSSRWLGRRIREGLAGLAPDVVAVPGWAWSGALAALAWSQAASVPVIVMSETTAWDARRRWWREAAKRRVVGLCAAGLVGGTPHAAYLASLGMPAERIFRGYDVVDNRHFAAGAELARRDANRWRETLGLPGRYFLASGRFVATKNLLGLLRAYARYRERVGSAAWHLVVLGDGPLRGVLARNRETLSIQEAVLMPGFRSYEELPIYYGLASAFVHASTVEPWGLVVNEAMAAGLPILVSDRCGCAQDLVRPGRNGFTFDPFDIGGLAELMLSIASEGCDREGMGQASHELIAFWSPELFASNLLRCAELAMNSPRPRAEAVNRALLRLMMLR